ncbi:MAG: hypothetical protein Q8O19_04830 [Rectinemataceae bacterium]|nr:hypothetical protein [Rectinemataceae bacterium]
MSEKGKPDYKAWEKRRAKVIQQLAGYNHEGDTGHLYLKGERGKYDRLLALPTEAKLQDRKNSGKYGISPESAQLEYALALRMSLKKPDDTETLAEVVQYTTILDAMDRAAGSVLATDENGPTVNRIRENTEKALATETANGFSQKFVRRVD